MYWFRLRTFADKVLPEFGSYDEVPASSFRFPSFKAATDAINASYPTQARRTRRQRHKGRRRKGRRPQPPLPPNAKPRHPKKNRPLNATLLAEPASAYLFRYYARRALADVDEKQLRRTMSLRFLLSRIESLCQKWILLLRTEKRYSLHPS
ncbi:hypothetical protein BH24ACI3_BH24ACI3_11250 [soil metagenome]